MRRMPHEWLNANMPSLAAFRLPFIARQLIRRCPLLRIANLVRNRRFGAQSPTEITRRQPPLHLIEANKSWRPKSAKRHRGANELALS